MKRSIRLSSQLRRINRVALATALSMVLVMIVISSFVLDLLTLTETSRVQGVVLAENAAATLMFEDAKSADELLKSLRNSPDVEAASLYAKDGLVFASYQRNGYQCEPRQSYAKRPPST